MAAQRQAKICLRDPLERAIKDELPCQVLTQFEAKGLSPRDLDEIQSGPRSLPIVYPWDRGYYNTLRNNYNRRLTYYPMAIIECRDVRDVRRSVRFVRRHKLAFSIRSGTHCGLAFSLSTGIIIDLSQMDGIKVHRETVALGPGAPLGLVVKQLSARGRALATGSCPNNGSGGYVVGGGISPSSIRTLGLICDHLASADVVLADGRLVKADAKTNPDLFFALRGAGNGSYGIVVNMELRTSPYSPGVAFSLRFQWTKFERVISVWQGWAPSADRRLNSELTMVPPRFNSLPVEVKGQLSRSSREELREALEATGLVRLADRVDLVEVPTYADSARFWAGGPETTQNYFESNSIFWYKPLSREAIASYRRSMDSAPSRGSFIAFNAMGGEVSRRGSDETAFPHRQALFWSLHEGTTLDPAELPAQRRWVNDLFASVAPWAQRVAGAIPCYSNVPSTNLQPYGGYLASYFAANVPRLVSIKDRYDPKNLFRFAQSIPTSLPPLEATITESEGQSNTNANKKSKTTGTEAKTRGTKAKNGGTKSRTRHISQRNSKCGSR